MKRFFSLAVLAVSSSLMVSQVNAETASTTFDVKLNVLKSCSIAKPNDISFGDLSFFDLKNQSASTTLNVACTVATDYKLEMWGSNNMKLDGKDGSDSLIGYNIIFNDANNTKLDHLTGNGQNQSYKITATLSTKNSNVKAGKYSDTVTAQISY